MARFRTIKRKLAPERMRVSTAPFRGALKYTVRRPQGADCERLFVGRLGLEFASADGCAQKIYNFLPGDY